MAEARRWDGDHRRVLTLPGRLFWKSPGERARGCGQKPVRGEGVEEDRNWVDGPLLTSASLVHQEARSSAESE